MGDFHGVPRAAHPVNAFREPGLWKRAVVWLLVLAPSIASVVLANLAPAMGARPIMHHSVEVALAVLYFTLRYMYQTYRLSSAKPGLS